MTEPLTNTQPWRSLAGDVALFVAAVIAVAWAVSTYGLGELRPGIAAGFLVFGLLSIFCGFPHPYFGHISFDRVAQFSSLLILGPVAAALINMTASLIYPWHRLRYGHTLAQVISASLANAGMMGLNLLISGSVYVALGGPIPLTTLATPALAPLVAMAITAHLLNDMFMAGFVWLAGGRIRLLFNWFTAAVEAFAFLVAFVVAIAYQRLTGGDFGLFLAVLGVGMLAVRQLALLRHSLERQVTDRTRELKARTDELDRLVQQDALTGLHNRRFMDERLATELQRAHRYERPLTVALADVDRFKQINDRYSHAAGDGVLRRLSRILASGSRETDLVARYGGEEFVLCFPETAAADAVLLCERLRVAVERYDWPEIHPGLHVTISFGIGSVTDPGQSVADLLSSADQRLYQAKHEGRNRVAGPAKLVKIPGE